MNRKPREEILMSVAVLISQRSTCSRKRVGAIAAREGRVLVTGHNGAPAGFPHCIDQPNGCRLGPDGGCKDAVHAEANIIAFAARYGIPLEGAEIYTTCAPCISCAKLIINAGVKKVIYLEPYRCTDGVELLKQAGIIVEQFSPSDIFGG